MKKNILIFSMSSYFEWEERDITNRNRQIVNSLVNSKEINKVIMVDFLPFNLKRIIREYILAKIYKKDKNTILKGSTYKVNKINNKLTIISCLFFKDIFKIFKRLELNFKDFIVWSFNPLNIKFLELESKIKVFDTVDNWSYNEIYSKYKNTLINNYKEIDKKASCIFTVSDDLKNIFSSNKNVFWMPNGVDFYHYQINNNDKLIQKFKTIKSPIFGYLGHIQDRLDFNLIEYLISNNQNLYFIFAGKIWESVAEKVNNLQNKYSNIYFSDFVSYKESPYYINYFDVCLIPHIVNNFSKSMNPLKLYEYLACGKPIISTNIAGLDNFSEHVFVANNKQEFNDLLIKALETKNIKIKERKNVVKDYLWKKRITLMLSKIKT